MRSFQLTPSRRATSTGCPAVTGSHYFNSRPHGGRQIGDYSVDNRHKISPHPLPAGALTQVRFSFVSPFHLPPTRRATAGGITLGMLGVFQLTPSRRATVLSANRRQERQISTHALTEGDDFLQSTSTDLNDFNSRPHGGRRTMRNFYIVSFYFNSRPHGGRRENNPNTSPEEISTHALTEGDSNCTF